MCFVLRFKQRNGQISHWFCPFHFFTILIRWFFDWNQKKINFRDNLSSAIRFSYSYNLANLQKMTRVQYFACFSHLNQTICTFKLKKIWLSLLKSITWVTQESLEAPKRVTKFGNYWWFSQKMKIFQCMPYIRKNIAIGHTFWRQWRFSIRNVCL